MSTSATREELLQKGEVRQMIAERAYFIAEEQGFLVGRDEDNWITAEAETLNRLLQETVASTTNGAAVSTTTKKKAPSKKAAVQVAPAETNGVEANGVSEMDGVVAAPKRTRKKSV